MESMSKWVDKIMNVKIEESWKTALVDEFNKEYFIKLTDFVRSEYLSGKAIYPAPANIFLIYVHWIK